MDSLGMPLIGMDFLRGKPLFIALETNELVDNARNRTLFHRGCSDKKCEKHTIPEEIITTTEIINDGKNIAETEDRQREISFLLEPFLYEFGNRADPSRTEVEQTCMYLHSPLGKSLNGVGGNLD